MCRWRRPSRSPSKQFVSDQGLLEEGGRARAAGVSRKTDHFSGRLDLRRDNHFPALQPNLPHLCRSAPGSGGGTDGGIPRGYPGRHGCSTTLPIQRPAADALVPPPGAVPGPTHCGPGGRRVGGAAASGPDGGRGGADGQQRTERAACRAWQHRNGGLSIAAGPILARPGSLPHSQAVPAVHSGAAGAARAARAGHRAGRMHLGAGAAGRRGYEVCGPSLPAAAGGGLQVRGRGSLAMESGVGGFDSVE